MSQSAGTLIGAILESTGYHYQSAVLDAMANPFASEVGGLIYLVGIVVAVACVATQGSYKLGPWLLIGPPLFFATVQPRDEIQNARWQHGRQERPQERVDAGVEDAGITRGPPEQAADGDAGENHKPPRVSRLFERYVQLVSATTDEIVHRISRGRENADLSFLLKSELFALMHIARIDDVGFRRLLHHAVLMECGQLIAWGRMANDPLFRKSTNPLTGERYEAAPGAREAREFLRPSQQYALKKYNELYAQAEINLHDEAARYVAMLRISEKAREGQAEEGPGEEQIQEETRRVRSEVTSCREIWGYTVRSILGHAERSHEKLRDLGEHLGIDRSVLDNLLAQAQGDPLAQPLVYGKDSPAISATQADQIGRAISVYLLRNEEANPDRGSWIAYFANRHESRNIRMRAQSFDSFTEQARVAVREWAEKERLIHAAGSLPYLQGLALYFLGITFPFFALLLLVPGKQSGFLLWFVLWLWVKSWDIGVAIVMLLEDTIFAILAVERQVLGHVPKLDAESDMGVAFAILRDLDPTFQLGTYHSILGTCILAVPPAMGQIILGSMRAGVLLVARGSSQFSQIFADAALAHDTRSAMQALRGDASALKRERARRYAAALRHGRSLVDAAAARPGAAARAGSDGGGARGRARPGGGGRRGGGIGGGRIDRGDAGGRPRRPGGGDGMVRTPPSLHLGAARPGVPSGEARRRQADRVRPGAAHFDGVSGDGQKRASGAASATSDLVLRAIQSFLMGGRLDVADFESIKELQAGEAGFIASLANWQQDTSRRQHELYSRIAIHGGIPIPWSNFTSDDSESVVRMAMQRQHAEIRRRIALYRTHQDGYDLAHALAEKALGMAGLPGLSGATSRERLANLRARCGGDPAARRRFRAALDGLGLPASTIAWVYAVAASPTESRSARRREAEEKRVEQGITRFLDRLEEEREEWLDSPIGPSGYREDFAPDFSGRLVDHLRFAIGGNDGGSIDPQVEEERRRAAGAEPPSPATEPR